MKNMQEFIEYFTEKYPGHNPNDKNTWILMLGIYAHVNRFNYLHGILTGLAAGYLFFVLKIYTIIPWHIAG